MLPACISAAVLAGVTWQRRCQHLQQAVNMTVTTRLPLLVLEDAGALAQTHASRGAHVRLLVEAEAGAAEAHIVALAAGFLGKPGGGHAGAALAGGVVRAGVGGASVAEGAAAGRGTHTAGAGWSVHCRPA